LYLSITFNNYRPGLLPIIYGEALLSASPQAIVTQHTILLNVSLQIAKQTWIKKKRNVSGMFGMIFIVLLGNALTI
jgi:hypothetical protein